MILIYCRVSSTEQAADGTSSLQDQERKGRAIAQLRGAGSFDVAVYIDPGVSGATSLHEREAGARMLDDARPGDVIVAAKLDRLFRNAADALTTAEKLREGKIELVLVDMGVESVTTNGVSRLFFGMLSLVAEFERERINERTADGREAKRVKGGCVGGVPYGWKKLGEGRESRLVTVAREQEIIRRIDASHARKESSWKIASGLNADGVPTRSGGPWQATQVQRVIDRLESSNREAAA